MAHHGKPQTTAATSKGGKEKRPGVSVSPRPGSEPVAVHAAGAAATAQGGGGGGVRTAGVHISVLHVLVIGEDFHEAA